MEVVPTPLAGLVVVRPWQQEDERGSFTRVWDATAFAAAGLTGRLEQVNASWNRCRNTLRGMHWQEAPHSETKLVRCVRGRVFDVAVDVRVGSTTRLKWFGLELAAGAGTALYVPDGFAHGFLTLEDDTEVQYVMTADHHPPSARGLRWDDPAVRIDWPATPQSLSARDASYRLLEES